MQRAQERKLFAGGAVGMQKAVRERRNSCGDCAGAQKAAYYDCHVHLEEFGTGRLEELRNGSVRVIANAVDMGSYGFAMKEALRNANVHRVFIGLHPDRADIKAAEGIAQYVKENKVDGVGEIGLDAKYGKMDLQAKVFREMLSAAQDNGLPVAVHSRNSVKEVLEILKAHDVRVMMHWFSGGGSELETALGRGYFIGITPSHAAKECWVVERCPIERILLETDSPTKGRAPEDVVKLANGVARAKGIALGEFLKQHTENVERFCGRR